MYLHHLSSWLLLNAVVILVFVLSSPSIRGHLAPSIVRLGSRTFAQLRPVAEVDQEADYLSNVLRRQQLVAHVQRLQRILANDLSMSATRQIANRIAYAQLMSELRSTPTSRVRCPVPPSGVRPHFRADGASHTAPAVEILEIGWRRQRSKPLCWLAALIGFDLRSDAAQSSPARFSRPA
jgi:hypothetical protein